MLLSCISGLTPRCFTFIDATLYSRPRKQIDIIIPDINFTAIANTNKTLKFYVPEHIDHMIMIIDNIDLSSEYVHIQIQADKIPTADDNLSSFNVYQASSTKPFYAKVWTKEKSWHYIHFSFEGLDKKGASDQNSSVSFKFKMFSSVSQTQISSNTTADLFYKTAIPKIEHTKLLTHNVPYKQYNLVRDATTESFMFSYDLQIALEQSSAVPINITTEGFSVLRFELNDVSDIGGTLQVIMAFKPRVKGRVLEEEPSNNKVVACVRRNAREIPTWPNKCVFNNEEKIAPLILNGTVDNTTVYILFPEPGVWFATFKLFDGSCEPCNCSESCSDQYNDCTNSCEETCTLKTDCNSCSSVCKQKILSKTVCGSCDCDGPCKKEKKESNSSILFDVSSYPCMTGKCGDQGKCMFMLSSGIVYSTCVCSNNYRGKIIHFSWW